MEFVDDLRFDRYFLVELIEILLDFDTHSVEIFGSDGQVMASVLDAKSYYTINII